MMKKLAIALVAMMLVMSSGVYAEEEAHGKCACGDACDHNSCACKTCPAAVKEAAMKALKDAKLGCVHVKKTDAGQVFTFNATVGDKAYTITVAVDGEGKVGEGKAEAVEEKKEE